MKVTITGKVLDLDFARILARHKDLTLEEIILLDKVQKRKPISDADAARLRKKKLIEGRKPNYYLSRKLAQKTGQKAIYSKAKAFDKQYYFDLILKAIGEHDYLERKDIDELLWNKLPEWMDEKQKKHRVKNLLWQLSQEGKINNIGTRNQSKWVIGDSNS